MEEIKDYLQNIEEETFLRPATPGTRFLNYIIDVVVYYVFNFLVGLLMMPLIPGISSLLLQNPAGFEFFFLGVALAIYFLYYFLLEGITKGRTVGKLITGTKAVTIDGDPITWKNAVMRTLIRFVPFEPFSTFGSFPWHDTWTYTLVVKEQR